MSIIFDELMPSQVSAPGSVGVSTSGKYVVSSNSEGTFLETASDTYLKPIPLLHDTCDTIGFYGSDLDAVALASGSTLRILQLSKMSIVSKMTIRPGSLFVPKTGQSPYVGVVSESGQTFLIDEDGNAMKSTLKVGQNHDVIWSAQTTPTGYTWVTDSSANLYVRSRTEDAGAMVSSDHGMTLYTVHQDLMSYDNVVTMTTMDEPHVLKTARSAVDSMIINPSKKFDQGVTIDQVVQLPSGRPIVASGYRGTDRVSIPVEGDTKLSDLLRAVLADPRKYSAIQCMGMSSYLSWEQTPINKPTASVTNYALQGRPRYNIQTTVNRNLLPEPVTNEVVNVTGIGGHQSSYRIVSRYTMGKQMVDNAVVVCDTDGSIASGKYSPSVEMLYRKGIPVVIVPVNYNKSTPRIVIEDLVDDLDDISTDVMSRKIARHLVLIASGDVSTSGIKALLSRKSNFSKLILIDPTEEQVSRIPSRRKDDALVLSTDDIPVLSDFVESLTVTNGEDIDVIFDMIRSF